MLALFTPLIMPLCSPELHPFEAEREYQRALNAVKLERTFAKPFVGSLEGHRDGLTNISKHPKVYLLLNLNSRILMLTYASS